MATQNVSVNWDEIFMKTQISVAYVLVILPLCVYVLFLGFQRQRSQRNSSSSAMSYSDFFTYNVALMELIGTGGMAVSLFTMFSDYEIASSFFNLGCFSWHGQMLYPVLTCVEHYVAVVHPVTYLAFKKRNGLLFRNICNALIWLFSFVLMIAVFIIQGYKLPFFIVDTCQMIVSLLIMLYCSLSILRILNHAKPGDSNKHKMKGNKAKRQAFCVIVLIMIVLFILFSWGTMFAVFAIFTSVGQVHYNILTTITYWLNSFTSLLLPLLYLHRAGKLACCGLK